MIDLRITASAVCIALAASTAICQTTIYRIDGDARSVGLRAVASAGDVDADGHDDIIVGQPYSATLIQLGGAAIVISGRTGLQLYRYDGTGRGDYLGRSVDGAGDVNADGFADFIVGATGEDNNGTNSGAAFVYSGRDGTELYRFDGDSAWDSMGISVSGAGDVNADGFDDVIVGIDQDDNNGDKSGTARVFSGRDGSVLWSFDGDSTGDQFGFSVSGAGDVNADGFDDVIVGAFGDDNGYSNSGSARVFSGRDGTLLFGLDGDAQADDFGYSVSGAGDVNRDGHADFIVGAPGEDLAGRPGPGFARVFSGIDGAKLFTFRGDSDYDHFGTSVAGAGDVNGDGTPDLVVGADEDDNRGKKNSGMCRLLSGANGSTLFSFNGLRDFHELGAVVAAGGDVDADGFADVLVSAPRADFTAPGSGSAYVLSGGAVGTPAITRITGSGCAGSNGHMPRVRSGRPRIGDSFQVDLRGALPNSLVALNLGAPTLIHLTPVGMPGCTLYATGDGFNLAATTDTNGLSRTPSIPAPNDPGIIGLPMNVQWLLIDPLANAFGITLSNTAELLFGN